MTNFEVFLAVNNLKKTDVARYLDVSNSNISNWSKGSKIPPERLKKILDNTDWDSSILVPVKPMPAPATMDAREVMEYLQSQNKMLQTIVNNQTAIISTLQAIVDNLVSEKENKAKKKK